ncbi:CHAT domain-containing tetratricopeptide repeat protein [Streptomyces sp. NPDC088194]|uniref:CHAT domain-containing tetratricopeptide repeat protein n=1 Tax=Streptomyces sp. NPDC088194 TaxID=3154931 RepID=UPI00344E37C2
MPDEDRDVLPVQLALRALSSPTYEEVLAHFGRIPPGRHEETAAVLRQQAETDRSFGRGTFAELAVFLAERCEALAVTAPAAGPAGGSAGGEGFPGLLRRACAARGVLGAYRVLEGQRALIPDEPVRAATRLLAQWNADRSGNAHAIAALGLLTDHGPSRTTARADWANHLLGQGRHRRALYHAAHALSLQHAVGDAHSLVNTYLQLASVYVAMGDPPRRAEVLRQAAAAVDREPEVTAVEEAALRFQLAQALIALHHYREAVPALERAEALTAGLDDAERSFVPARSDLLGCRARVAEAVGALGAAVDAYRALLELPQTSTRAAVRASAVYGLASCLERNDRQWEAFELLGNELERAEQQGAGALNAVSLRCTLARLLFSGTDPRLPRDTFTLESHLVQGLFEAAGSTYPCFGELFVTMGDLDLSEDRHQGAAECYRYALYVSGDPGHARQPERLPERLRTRMPLTRLLPAEGFHDSLSFALARLRERMLRLFPAGANHLPDTRLLALQRLCRVERDPRRREQLADRLAEGLRRAIERDALLTLQDLTVPVCEAVAEVRGPLVAARLAEEVLASYDAHGRLPDPDLPLGLARLLLRVPGGHRRAFEVLWHHRELRLRARESHPVLQDADQAAGLVLRLYEALLSLLFEHGDDLPLPDGRPPDLLAFDLHEETKARGVVEDLARMPLAEPPQVPQRVWAEERRLLSAQRRLAGGERPDRAWAWRECAGALGLLYEQLEPFVPEYVRLRTARPAGFAEASRLLNEAAPAEGMVLASYFTGESETFCFVLASGEDALRWHRIRVGRAQLHAAAEKIRRTVDGDRSAFPPVPPIRPRRPSPLPLEGLAARLMPFQDLLEGRGLLCVAPHGPLSVLPLGALRLPDGRYCVEQAALVYIPSISALAALRAAPPAGSGSALCVRVAAEEDLRGGGSGFEADTLPAGRGWRLSALTGPQATPEEVLDHIARADLAYIACHGHQDHSDPENSALLLSDGTDRPSRQADPASQRARRTFLRARDLSGSRTPSRVVLRACSVGWHEPDHPGEDFTGLPRALLRGGTRTVLAPIWQVDRTSSAALLDEVTGAVMDGRPLWRALWDAQRRMLADEDRRYLSHPYHWAAFVPLGDWS